MKLNKIFMALSAMAIVGCSSEDFNDPSVAQAIDDSRLIQLDESFVLAGVGEGDGVTRSHWDQAGKSVVNVFLPVFTANATADKNLGTEVDGLEKDAIGLCWLGQVPGTDVYTNYQFYHFGWLKEGQTEAKLECNALSNGVMYDEIKVKADVTATPEAPVEAIPATHFTLPTAKSSWELNYNSGVYKTDNKAIFGGDYIVYYPYNQKFNEAGTIPAVAETMFAPVATVLTDPKLGKATFRYSNKVHIDGGNQAADFGLQNLSTLVRLTVYAPATDAMIGNDIDQIVLYSANKQLYKQVNLAADKIVAGEKGVDLYASTEGTQTIVAKFGAATTLGEETAPINAFITVLPTEVKDLAVLVHNKNAKKWARVEMPDTKFEAGKAKLIDIEVKSADFKSDFIAVDQASLETALTDARSGAAENTPQTITVIGDIKLTSDLNIDDDKDAFITIKGDAIIVPEDVTLNLKNITMESDVRVLGMSCCSGATNGGRLVIEAGGAVPATLNNVTMVETEAKTKDEDTNPMVTFSGAATIVAGKKFDVQAGKVQVDAAVAHKGDIVIAKGAKVIVNGDDGDLQFMGSTVVNNGTIEVMKDGNFDMTDADGNASASDGERMTNNGTFIHNVDAGVGTAVQSMNQKGEYRCRVNDQVKLDDAFLQWTACSVIEIVTPSTDADKNYNLATAAGVGYKHNNKFIDIEVNNATGTKKTIFNNPNTEADDKVQIGNFTVTKGEVEIDFVADKKRDLEINGNMVVKDNTTFTDSKSIAITGNLTVEGAGKKLTYEGKKQNEGGLAVAGDITVSAATFDAGAGTAATDVDALKITCVNFSLAKGGTAVFGNRTDGAGFNLAASGTITNPEGCTFNIEKANRVGSSVIGVVTCKKLVVGGNFPNSRPQVK